MKIEAIRAEIYTDKNFEENDGGKLERAKSEELDAILGIPFKCLDKGFLRVVDYQGAEESIVRSARVSYGKGTKKINEDKGLINYLLAHAHTTPFEMLDITFHCKMPIFIARQWIRHRTASVNEYSARYSLPKDEFYIPDASRVQLQSKTNKQGSGEVAQAEVAENFREYTKQVSLDAMANYLEFNMEGEGLARELNRINMPVSNYTEWYWKINLHNLMHFLRLREDSHAQFEIQQYGLVMTDIVKLWVPNVHEAYCNYVRDAVKLSKAQYDVIKSLLDAADLEIGYILSHHEEDKEFLEKNKISKRELQQLVKLF